MCRLNFKEMRLRTQSLKIMNQEKVIKQQVDLIYDMRAKVHKEVKKWRENGG